MAKPKPMAYEIALVVVEYEDGTLGVIVNPDIKPPKKKTKR